MQTAKEREISFRADLAALFAKHKAVLEMSDDDKGYGMHRGIAIVSMLSERDEQGTLTAEYTEFTL